MADVRRHFLDNGICITCGPHALDNGNCVTCRAVDVYDTYLLRDPYTGGWIEGGERAARALFASRKGGSWQGQPRDPGGEDGGQWVSSPAGAAGGALKDALKLAGKIDIGGDEHLAGSAKVDGDDGNVYLAAIDSGGRRRLRIGVGDAQFGSRYDAAGPWRAGTLDQLDEVNAEREQLSNEYDDLEAEYERADPERQKAIDKRLRQLDKLDLNEAPRRGHTADVSTTDLGPLRTSVPEAFAQADSVVARFEEHEQQRQRIEVDLDKLRAARQMPAPHKPRPYTPAESARVDELERESAVLEAAIAADEGSYGWEHVFVEGVVAGREHDLRYRVNLVDDDAGWQMIVAAVPRDDPSPRSDWFYRDDAATLRPDEARALLRLLDRMSAAK